MSPPVFGTFLELDGALPELHGHECLCFLVFGTMLACRVCYHMAMLQCTCGHPFMACGICTHTSFSACVDANIDATLEALKRQDMAFCRSAQTQSSDIKAAVLPFDCHWHIIHAQCFRIVYAYEDHDSSYSSVTMFLTFEPLQAVVRILKQYLPTD